MTDETAEQVLTRVLGEHESAPDFHCECGEDMFGGTFRYSVALHHAHVAAELAAALREAGHLVGAVVTDWQPVEGGGDDAA